MLTEGMQQAAVAEEAWGLEDVFASDPELLAFRASLDGPGAAAELGLAQAEFFAWAEARAAAQKLAAIHRTLTLARDCPEVFGSPGCGTGREAVEFSERSAVAELAVALGMSEGELRSQASTARLLVESLPRLWDALASGTVSLAKVRAVAEVARELGDDATALAAFDAAIAEAAPRMTAARLRTKARVLRERLHPRPARERHEAERGRRHVWVDDAPDGMSWLNALLPSEAAHRAFARIDANARHLATAEGEARTLAQLQADVLCDLLTGDGTEHRVRAVVNVQVPVEALRADSPAQPGSPTSTGLTRGDARDNPALLNGVTPVDPVTARLLCGDATSLYRILIDPIDGAVLTVGRSSYRAPADLARLVRARHPRCAFPGCARAAESCDLDHVRAWAHGGETAHDNLIPLCRRHHRLKHHSRWQVEQNAGAPARPARDGGPTDGTGVRWRSPTGRRFSSDPPF